MCTRARAITDRFAVRFLIYIYIYIYIYMYVCIYIYLLFDEVGSIFLGERGAVRERERERERERDGLTWKTVSLGC